MKKCSSPTLKTIAILSKVGNVGKSLPRSIFESIAAESPVWRPSSTRPIFFLSLSRLSFSPMAYFSSPSVSVSESIRLNPFERGERKVTFWSSQLNQVSRKAYFGF